MDRFSEKKQMIFLRNNGKENPLKRLVDEK